VRVCLLPAKLTCAAAIKCSGPLVRPLLELAEARAISFLVWHSEELPVAAVAAQLSQAVGAPRTLPGAAAPPALAHRASADDDAHLHA
jgi:hypothetical protein